VRRRRTDAFGAWRGAASDRPKGASLRVLVHDFSGHPFQIDLSRRLAQRGYEVIHVYCPSYASGKGRFSDGSKLDIIEIPLGAGFRRYNPIIRIFQELLYGLRFIQIIRTRDPDIVISCNDPLLAKAIFGMWCTLRKIRWIFWLQDIYSVAMTREIHKRHLPFAGLMGAMLQSIERHLLHSSECVVLITEDFWPVLDRWGIREADCSVIENWAPIEEIPLRPRVNDWGISVGIASNPTFIYSGTLGLKHNPDLLYDLANHVLSRGAQVIVISEGMGIDRLCALQSEHELPNLRLLPFQPYERLPDVLGSADVLLVLLERDAGVFSVPSKVLNCLCSGRPILGVMPRENLAARTILRANAGNVVDPGDQAGFLDAADTLLRDEAMRKAMGSRAREFAELKFNGDAIADQFEVLLTRVAGSSIETTN